MPSIFPFQSPALFLFPFAFLAGTAPCKSADDNGMRLLVQKTTLERKDQPDLFRYWDTVDKALAIQCEIRNLGFHPRTEGEIHHSVIVKRWRHTPPRHDRYEGTEPLQALKPSETIKKIVGRIPISGYINSHNRRDYVDSIEAWRVTVSHESKETVVASSGAKYDKLLPESNLQKESGKSAKQEQAKETDDAKESW